MLTCGIVILNYEDYKTTEFLLTHIKDCTEIEHIVVVDNASPNDSYTYLKKYESDKVSVIQSGKNGGYSLGNNFGARYLIKNFHPDIIGIANPDTEFDGAFVGRIKAAFEYAPDYALLTGIQHLPSGEIFYNPFWEEDTALANIEVLLLKILIKSLRAWLSRKFTAAKTGRIYEEYRDKIINNPEPINEVWAVMGCLFFIRAKDFEAVGLFDENVFLYFEEYILACRLQRIGRKSGVVNDITFVHAHRKPANEIARINASKFANKCFEASYRYYFNNYMSDSWIVQRLFAFLRCLYKIKGFILYTPKRILSKFRGKTH